MFKLQYLFIYLMSFCTSLLFAQSSDVKYDVSPPYELVKNLDFEFFSNKELGISVGYKINYGEVKIQSYDTESMKVIASNKLEHFILNLAWVKDKLYGFYEFRASKKSTPYIYAREIDYKTCQFKGKEIKLFSAHKMIYETIPLVRTADVFVEQSEDKSKTLVYALHIGSTSNGSISSTYVSLITLNQDFEKISAHKYKMPDSEQQIEDRIFRIDNAGNPYMIYKVYNDKITKEKRFKQWKEVDNYKVILFKFDLDEKDFSKVEIPFEESFLARSFSLFQGKNNELIIAGYYNINRDPKGVPKNQNMEGGFLISVSVDLEVSPIIKYSISQEYIFKHTEFWKDFISKKTIKKAPTELQNLVVSDLIIGEDNSITIIGEQRHNYTYTTDRTTGGEFSREYYYYDNLLISKLDKDGTLDWMTKVPKKLKGPICMNTPGYIHTKVNDHHYFFIQDDRDNTTTLDDHQEIIRERMEHHGNFCLFKVNSNTGKLSKHVIFDMMDVKGVKTYNLRMDRLMWYSDNEFILECYKKKKEDVMIKVRITE